MSNYLLDTSFLIDLMEGEDDALGVHQRTKGAQATTTVCLYELSKFEGFEPSSVESRRVLRFSSGDASYAGELYRSLRSEGEPIGETDSMIAGVALNRGMEIVTRDEDFKKVGGLETLYYK